MTDPHMDQKRDEKTPTQSGAPDRELELKVKKHPDDADAKVDLGSGEAMDAVNLAEALAEIYRVFAEEVLDEQQVFVSHFERQTQPKTSIIQVDEAASQAIFVQKYSPPDADLPTIFLNDPNGGGGGTAPLGQDRHRHWGAPRRCAVSLRTSSSWSR